MHADPYDLDALPARSVGGGKPSPAKRLIIADRLYQQMHAENPGSSGNAGAARTAKSQGGLSAGPASRPQLLMCYLCGQQFGTSSLHIHQPQCYVKKLVQWERSEGHLRGPKPMSPDEFAAQSGTAATAGDMPIRFGDSRAVEEFNAAQFKNYTEKMLVPCEHCGRTFLPDRLQVHQRSCRPGHEARRVAAGGGITSPGRQRPSTATNGNGAETLPAAANARSTSPTAARGRAAAPPSMSMDVDPRELSTTVNPSSPNADGKPATAAARALAEHLVSRDGGSPEDGSPRGGPRRTASPRDLGRTRAPANTTKSNNGSNSVDAMPLKRPGVLGGDDEALLAGSRSTDDGAAMGGGSWRKRAGAAGGPGGRAELVPCKFCERTFAPARIEKHESVCVERNKPMPGAGGGGAASSGARPSSSSGGAGRVPQVNVGRVATQSPARVVTARVDSGLRRASPKVVTSRAVAGGSAASSPKGNPNLFAQGGGGGGSGTFGRPSNSSLSSMPVSPSLSPAGAASAQHLGSARGPARAASGGTGAAPTAVTAGGRASTTNSNPASSLAADTTTGAPAQGGRRRSDSPSTGDILASLDALQREIAAQRASTRTPKNSSVSGGVSPSLDRHDANSPPPAPLANEDSEDVVELASPPNATAVAAGRSDRLASYAAQRPRLQHPAAAYSSAIAAASAHSQGSSHHGAARQPRYSVGGASSAAERTSSGGFSDSSGSDGDARRAQEEEADVAALHHHAAADNGLPSGASSIAPSDAISNATSRPPKFCSECGTRVATASAKFCCECGVKLV